MTTKQCLCTFKLKQFVIQSPPQQKKTLVKKSLFSKNIFYNIYEIYETYELTKLLLRKKFWGEFVTTFVTNPKFAYGPSMLGTRGKIVQCTKCSSKRLHCSMLYIIKQNQSLQHSFILKIPEKQFGIGKWSLAYVICVSKNKIRRKQFHTKIFRIIRFITQLPKVKYKIRNASIYQHSDTKFLHRYV
eukprot:TRINITY_DN7129_c0_g1_i1.p2 TRINITY_DN7129_c0_g1~~TRINITY_DN7129_c0_g1_i1.p2  ORF type:complete len:187 (+),score=-13.57 TRINITY_DN7129_c0_g1_i1:502-1062(+)